MNRICVVNVNWLGDAVFSLPVFSSLRKTYPQAHIACLCVPRVAEVLSLCPDIDAIIIIDEKKKHFWPWQKLGLILHLRAQHFDAAFILHRSFSRALMIWLAGIKKRIGFCKWPWVVSQVVSADPETMHRMDYYVTVIEAMGIKSNERIGRLRVDTTGRIIDGEYVVFNTGGNWDLKRWPKFHWISLAREFKGLNVPIVFTGASGDSANADEIIQQSGIKALNECGKTTLLQSLQIYAQSKLVISSDSGPLHLAGSVGTKVLGLFGPTRPEITGPRGVGGQAIIFNAIGCNKTPCYHLSCQDNVCMKGISAQDVFVKAKEMLGL